MSPIEYRWGEGHNERLPASRGGPGSPAGGCHRHTGQHRRYARGQGSDGDDSHCLRHWRRPCENWPRCQPQPAGRQRHRDQRHWRGAWSKAARAFTRAAAGSRALCRARQSRQSVYHEPFVTELQTAASAIGRQIEVVNASTNSEIDTAFATLAEKASRCLLISPEALFVTRRVQLITLAARHALPATVPSA